jgi:hypothetical protein
MKFSEMLEKENNKQMNISEASSAYGKNVHKIRKVIYDNLYKLDIALSGGYTGGTNEESDREIKRLHDHVISLMRAKGDPLFDFVEFNKIIDKVDN